MAKIKIEKHDSVKMYRIRKTLDEISDKTGHGTELITVYIPKGKQLHEVISILKEEQGTADNIKSDFTRSHVVDSLGKVIQRLKMYKKTPERGLVVFCGALPPEGGGPIGSEVVRAYEIDPPKDLKTFLYRCDDHFHVDILKDMLKDDNLIGFLAIDAKDAGWGLLHGIEFFYVVCCIRFNNAHDTYKQNYFSTESNTRDEFSPQSSKYKRKCDPKNGN